MDKIAWIVPVAITILTVLVWYGAGVPNDVLSWICCVFVHVMLVFSFWIPSFFNRIERVE